MYGRTFTLIRIDQATPESVVRNFMFTIAGNEMYALVFDEIRSLPGFLYKKTIIIESANDLTSISQLVFDTEDNFKSYYQDPKNSSLIEYLGEMALMAGLNMVATEGAIDS